MSFILKNSQVTNLSQDLRVLLYHGSIATAKSPVDFAESLAALFERSTRVGTKTSAMGTKTHAIKSRYF